MYTLDTNAVIYYTKDDASAVRSLESLIQISPIYISTITELELFGFPAMTAEEEDRVATLLEEFLIVPLDSQIARIAARLRRSYRMKLPDSAIAATALFTGSTLVTRNVRDFKKVAGLSLRAM